MRKSGLLDGPTYDKITLRHLGPESTPKVAPMTGSQIRSLRERAKMSQAVFARHLNLTVGYVSQLERGAKQPTGAALALLNVIRRKGIEAIMQMGEAKEADQMKRKGRIGSTFESWLDEAGIRAEVTVAAIKAVIARQLADEMKKKKLTKKRMAELMKTSRAQLDRLLDPDNGSATIESLQRAAKIVGRELRMELV